MAKLLSGAQQDAIGDLVVRVYPERGRNPEPGKAPQPTGRYKLSIESVHSIVGEPIDVAFPDAIAAELAAKAVRSAFGYVKRMQRRTP